MSKRPPNHSKKARNKKRQNVTRATPEELEHIKKLLQGSAKERKEAVRLGEQLSRGDQTILMQWAVDKLRDALDYTPHRLKLKENLTERTNAVT